MASKLKGGEANQTKGLWSRTRKLAEGLAYDPDKYIYDDQFVPAQDLNASTVHTTPELIALINQDKDIEIGGRFLEMKGKRGGEIKARHKIFKSRRGFQEALKKAENHFKEGADLFAMDGGLNSIGQIVDSVDFIPILGGPFYKQLYSYDYLRMHSAAFYAWHHDPMAKAAINIKLDFVLGRGFKVESEDPQKQIMWDAFAKANDFQMFAYNYLQELLVYGESLVWKLPNNHSKIVYQLGPNQKIPVGIIPRVRLIDPSCIWEIVTYPEDITRVLYYQWIAPTQYQTYTAPGIPTTKFIFDQIPGDQVIHHKINCASNEKRGRSDLFAGLGYLKRLRDSVDYSIVAMQKSCAWSIDTTVEGSQEDLEAYAQSQIDLGTLPSAGSEFIHTKAIERKYLSNAAAGGGKQSEAFEWAFSMFCASMRLPVAFMNTHLSGGQTKASAIVATEPVAKMFENLQLLVERMVKELHVWVTGVDCEVIFSEVVTQDSATKIRNIVVADANEYISKDRAATLVAKELNITEFDYDLEKQQIIKDKAEGLEVTGAPLSAPPSTNPGSTNTSSANVTKVTGIPGAATSGIGAGASTGGTK